MTLVSLEQLKQAKKDLEEKLTITNEMIEIKELQEKGEDVNERELALVIKMLDMLEEKFKCPCRK